MPNSTLKAITLSLFLLLCAQSFANKIIVKGHIKNSDGKAETGRLVIVSIDSTLNHDCIQYHLVYTDSNGFYTDTLTCSDDIHRVIICTNDCNGELLVHKEEPGNNMIESDFTICAAPPTCNAAFDFWQDSLKLKMIHVYAGENAGEDDSVIERTWFWGDGDTLVENDARAFHEYKEDGVYSLCQQIKTRQGCVGKYCHTVEILSKCRARFEHSPLSITANGYGLRVYGSMSFVVKGDSVIRRVWKWGDGTKTEDLDSINASHYYKDTGSYNVCLFIQTKNGCRDTACTSISIPVESFHCNAIFVYSRDSNNVNFDSHESSAGPYDTIVSRIWDFGDSTYADGNNFDLAHEYKDTGWYTVCLTIKTKQGCENSICEQIRIEKPQQKECAAKFEYDLDSNDIKFNSGMSNTADGDSIIQRIWHWGDSTAEDGNHIDPTHEYKDTGWYTVCLTIKTKQGCENSMCENIRIEKPEQKECAAKFEYDLDSNGIKFNSTMSIAADGDFIIQRIWHWGDSTAEEGNHTDPTHEYKDTGWYTVCLTIKTRQGCENSTCEHIRIETLQQKQCTAKFEYNLLDDNGIKFNSSMSKPADGDSIIQRIWHWGDSTAEDGNHTDPIHEYKDTGLYTVCLTIKTKQGCENSICESIKIEKPQQKECAAKFEYDLLDNNGIQFNSSMSNTADGDSITQRVWQWGDSTAEDGNHIDPSHYYAHSGEYRVCLSIKTRQDCLDSTCSYVEIRSYCDASFTYVTDSNIVKFNSDESKADNGDSIISRRWDFGDSAILEDNSIEPEHVYMHPGIYYVCLTIKSARGCEKTECRELVIKEDSLYCDAAFTYEKISKNTFRFNSSTRAVSENDSIISRTWHFGDGTVQDGNHIDPVHYYDHDGKYNVCLEIKTFKGCEQEKCSIVSVDSSKSETEIVNLYPNPANSKLSVVVRSNTDNLLSVLTVINIYGQKQLDISKLLMQGDNSVSINTASLGAGTYFLRITTAYGSQSRIFLKQ